MHKLIRYIPELNLQRIPKNIKRIWHVYINPPKERNIFVKPKELKTIGSKVAETATLKQPKQVVFDSHTNFAFVSCMEGGSLQVFQIQKDKISLHKNINLEDQCVEVAINNGLIFVTTTNFERPPHKLRNKLFILDAKTQEIISTVDTQGNWSKFIAIRPQKDELFISNWHSHNISIIDIRDIKHPRVKQILKWGEAPRGIDFLPSGNKAIVTGFYSGNLGVLVRKENGKWEIGYTTPPFDYPKYAGNMRHIIVLNSKEAVISNLGRNIVHFWSVEKREFTKSILVGKSPNSLCVIAKKLLAVSCRDSYAIYFIDLKSRRLVGRSTFTGKAPTGLCGIKSGFLVTSFKSNKLEMHRIVPS